MQFESPGRRPLRFAVGARIECRVADEEWARGVVVAHHPADGNVVPIACYKLLLDRGDACLAPADHAEVGLSSVTWRTRIASLNR